MNIFNLALLQLRREKRKCTLINLIDRAEKIREYLDLRNREI